MLICYIRGRDTGIGAHTFIDRGWKNAIINDGHMYSELFYNSNLNDWVTYCIKHSPDCIIVANYPNNFDYIDVLKEARKKGAFVAHTIDTTVADINREIYSGSSFADIFFGEIEFDAADKIYKAIGKKNYWLLPCAADGSLHYPTDLMETNLIHDLVFLGSRRTNKSFIYESLLDNISKNSKYNTFVSGPFWTKEDYLLAFIQRFSGRLGFKDFSNLIGRMRLTVPPEDERVLYANSKVCLNIHERDSFIEQKHHIVNGRTFKIAASGGVLLSDKVNSMPFYFEEGVDYLSYSSYEEFIDRFVYLINNTGKRLEIRKKASMRAMNEHLQIHRLRDLISVIKNGRGRYMRRNNYV